MSTSIAIDPFSFSKRALEDCDDTAESSSSEDDHHMIQQVDSADEIDQPPDCEEVAAYNSSLYAIARERTGQWALCCVILLSICVATNSFLLLFQYHDSLTVKSSNSSAMDDMMALSHETPVLRAYSSEQVCASQPMVTMNMAKDESKTVEVSTAPFVWHSLMELEISILTNFIHSALLLAAGVVVYARGDTVWLFFVRHCAFFWTLSSIAYLSSAVFTLSNGGTVSLQWLAIGAFALFSALVWNRFGCAYQSIQYQSIVRGSVLSNRMDTKLPQRILYVSCALIQCMALLFYAITTLQYVQLQRQCDDFDISKHSIRWLHDIPDHNESSGTGSSIMESFVMAYSEAAHSSFLLSLVQLAATYPMSPECSIGAIIVAFWRMFVGALSLFHVMDTSSSATPRFMYSVIYTTIDITLMIPILLSGLWLFCLSTGNPLTCCLSSRRFNHVTQVDWVTDSGAVDIPSDCVEHIETGQCGSETETGDSLMIDKALDPPVVTHFECLTTSQIASSKLHTTRQRWGAYLMSMGSYSLLAEMTIECVLLQSQSFVGSNAKHDIYKWGLHACVICAFCTVMSVDILPSLYKQYSRPILLIACPTGTFVALWQATVLVQSSIGMDVWSLFAMTLFGFRAVCGVVQTVGTCLLNDIQSSYNTTVHCPTILADEKNTELFGASKFMLLDVARRNANMALYRMFAPSLVLYILVAVSAGNCSTPMLSPTVPVDAINEGTCIALSGMDLMLMQNFPGLGLFFHYGLVLILFTYDGIQTSPPTYRPSLYLASMWAANLAVVLFTDLVWDAIQTEWYTSDALSTLDVMRRILLLLWSISSGYLAGCLVRLWNLRVQRR
jgi:hypothetical protein